MPIKITNSSTKVPRNFRKTFCGRKKQTLFGFFGLVWAKNLNFQINSRIFKNASREKSFEDKEDEEGNGSFVNACELQ